MWARANHSVKENIDNRGVLTGPIGFVQPPACTGKEYVQDVVEDGEEDGDDCADKDAVEACDTSIKIWQRMKAEGEVSQGCRHPAEDAAEANFHLIKKQTRKDYRSKQRVVYKCRLKDEVYFTTDILIKLTLIVSFASLPVQQPSGKY